MHNTPGLQSSFSFSKILITLGFIGVCLGAVVFVWRIFSYYRDVKSGTLIPVRGYHATKATSERLAALAHAGEGSGLLATVDDPNFGSSDAPMTIVAFMDFGCPYSQEESYVLEALAHNAPSDVHIVLRDFPLTDLHPGADKAARAAECADEQGKYLDMYRALNKVTDPFTEDLLMGIAMSLGLDTRAWSKCMSSGYYEEELAQDIADGVAAGVTSTPTLFINGVKIEGAIPYGILYDAIQAFTQ